MKKNSCFKVELHKNILFLLLFVLVTLFNVWKSKYGLGGSDEAFYLTIPHRLTLGDSLFYDEWHISQLSSVLVFPFVYIYRLFNRSNEGIILFARYCYIVCHFIATCFIYYRIKRYGVFAKIASILYLIYTPFDIMALDYDSMGLEFVLLTGVSLATADGSRILLVLSGMFFSAAVLCNPYLGGLYLILAMIFLLSKFFNKWRRLYYLNKRLKRCLIYVSLGICVVAFAFIIFVLCRTDINKILLSIPNILNDPEHPKISLLLKVISYFWAIIMCHPMMIVGLLVYTAIFIVLIFDKNRIHHRIIYLSLSCVITIFCLLIFAPQISTETYNHIMFPIIFVGISSFALTKNKNWKVFFCIFLLGIVYSFCIHFASNTRFYAISMALTVSNVASFIFLGQLIYEIKHDNTVRFNGSLQIHKVLCSLLIATVVLTQMCLQITSKAMHVFCDSSPNYLSERIETGAAKDIYTTEKMKNYYSTLNKDLSEFCGNKEKDNILIFAEKTWLYLDADFDYGTYSAWLLSGHLKGNLSVIIEKLDRYYKMNPNKIPKYIYIPKTDEYDFAEYISDRTSNGYLLTENSISYRLIKQ